MFPDAAALCQTGALSPLSLRGEAEPDLPALESAYVALREPEFAQVPWPAEARAALVRHQFQICRNQYAQHRNRGQFVFCQGRTIAGWACLADLQQSIRLIDLALLPQWQGRGAGTHFLKALLALSRQQNRPVLLSVSRGNPAAQLYLRLGFKVERTGRSRDETHMEMRYHLPGDFPVHSISGKCSSLPE